LKKPIDARSKDAGDHPELAERLKMDEKFLAEKFDNFAKRGLVYRGRPSIISSESSFQFCGGPPAGICSLSGSG